MKQGVIPAEKMGYYWTVVEENKVLYKARGYVDSTTVLNSNYGLKHSRVTFVTHDGIRVLSTVYKTKKK